MARVTGACNRPKCAGRRLAGERLRPLANGAQVPPIRERALANVIQLTLTPLTVTRLVIALNEF